MDRLLSSSIQDIERNFQDLLHRLSSGLGPRGRLDLYHQFFSNPSGTKVTALYLSYYQEIYEDYLNHFSVDNLAYRSSHYLDDLFAICADMSAAGLSEVKDPAFAPFLERLRYQRVASRLFAGDAQGALTCLDLDPNTVHQVQGDNYHKFSEVKQTLNSDRGDVQSLLEQIDREWLTAASGTSNNTVWIPLVEKSQGNGVQRLFSATIQPLKVEVELRRKDAAQDLVFFNNHPMANNELIYHQALDAIAVARKHLKSYGRRNTPYFRVMFGFPDTEYFYTGDSFGLGMSLAVLAQMEKITIQRVQHTILNNAVVTGGLDANGLVRPISDESLPAKIMAFNYSPFQIFVHPAQNSLVANHTFGDVGLEQVYDLFPVQNISDVVKNETIVQQETISIKEWSKAHIRKNQVLRYTAAILLLVGFAVASWFFSRDLNPVRVEVNHNVLTAINSHNKQLWTHEILPAQYMKEYEANLNERLIKTVISDINNDGLNEILYSPITLANDYASRLNCLDSHGSVSWVSDLGDSVRFGETVYNRPFEINTLIVTRGQDESPLIVAIFNHYPWFPSKIALISKEGKILGTYYHGGSLDNAEMMDVSGDGVEDLVFCGTNNESRDGILGALNLSNISGHSPQQIDHYRYMGSAEANHIFYLRFPKGDWIDLEHKSKNFAIHHIEKAGDRNFNVTVLNKKMNYNAIYQFDTNMNYHGASFGDSMLDTYLTLHNRGLYQDYTREFVREKLDAIKSWDGVKWVDFIPTE